jgi:hypothetical protein
MRNLILFVLGIVILSGSVSSSENILVTALTTDKRLLVMNVEFANKKYQIKKSAVFNLPAQGGLTASALLPNGDIQIAWTSSTQPQNLEDQGLNTAGIKIYTMNLSANFDRISGIKKLGPTLTSHYNFGIWTSFENESSFSYDSSNAVVLRKRNPTSGNVIGPIKRVFFPPSDLETFDFCFASREEWKEFFYAALFYVVNQKTYGFAFGNTANKTPTTTGRFGGEVISGECAAVPNMKLVNYIYMEKVKGNIPRYTIESRKINVDTGLPEGNGIIQVPTFGGDLGTRPFFNGLSVTPSEVEPFGGHVFYIKHVGNTDKIGAYHMNTTTGKRDSSIYELDERNEFPDDPEALFLYGLFGIIH